MKKPGFPMKLNKTSLDAAAAAERAAHEYRTVTERSDAAEYSQCQEAVRRLTDYLSHELRPDEAESVQHHLKECRGCFAKFTFEETLLRTIRERAEQVTAPDALRARVLRLLADAPSETPSGGVAAGAPPSQQTSEEA